MTPQWTQADLDAFEAKQRPVKQRPKLFTGSPQAYVDAVTSGALDTTIPDLTIRPSTDEDKLNKTEKAYLARLRLLKVPCMNIQSITLKIADDCRFTPDFTYVDANGRLTFVDTKGGFIREDATIKIKVAARKFPEFRFVVAQKTKNGWEEKDVKP